jgi:hypothetical protein
MDPTTLQALQHSIAHWERLVSGKSLPEEKVNRLSCALCTKFWDSSCKGCPVAEKTNQITCEGTPYNEAWWTQDQYGINSQQFKEAAKQELDFLKSLLP